MKRFIDLRSHYEDIGCNFAWWDTVRNRFEEHSGSFAWHLWDEFERDYQGIHLDRYRSLAPSWLNIEIHES